MPRTHEPQTGLVLEFCYMLGLNGTISIFESKFITSLEDTFACTITLHFMNLELGVVLDVLQSVVLSIKNQ
jgi:hypothetical protein